MAETNPKARVLFGGIAVASVTILLLARAGAIPLPARAFIAGGVLLGWTVFAVVRFCRRFGRVGVVAVVLLVSGLAAWLGSTYYGDLPKQRQVAAIRALGPVKVTTSGSRKGSVWTGDIQYLHFDSDISEPQVLAILHSPGLEKLKRVVFKRTPITDATPARLAEMSSLQDISVVGGKITDAGVAKLRKSLPSCGIEIR